MVKQPYLYLVGDFETTVYDGQKETEVWASAVAIINDSTDTVLVHHSIDETFDYLQSLESNIVIYYHNLKFDGNFWLSYLLQRPDFSQAYTITQDNLGNEEYHFLKENEMDNNTFKYVISDMGQWYSLTIKTRNHYIEIRDSLKLLPFALRKLGKDFKTKHQKLEMEYKGKRFSGCDITPDEMEYIKNDALVLKECMEIMFSEGHNRLTIGSCCLSEFKQLIGRDDYKIFFPDLTQFSIDPSVYSYGNADAYIRRSYKGGWCYLQKDRANTIVHNGTTADVNSLYPSVMSGESGNKYPVGQPHFWSGNYIPEKALADNKYYFVRIKTRFFLKPNKLPFIQIKSSRYYRPNECLITSDIYNPKTGKYSPYYKDSTGKHLAYVTLTLTMTDYELIKQHYDLVGCTILDGCYFGSEVGIFDPYIDKYRKQKMESTGARRQIAKLFLNNLYGKMASSTDSDFKVAFLDEDGIVHFKTQHSNDKEAGYIAIGSAITSYARHFTITHAQKNYEHFIYADTDSIHCDCSPSELVGLRIDDNAFCAWKLESCWDDAIFVRQKTYIEHVTHENLLPVDAPYYNIKCAGMPERSKKLFERQLLGKSVTKDEQLTDDERKFLSVSRTLADFKVGLRVPDKLIPKRIRGGVVLVDSWYEMRPELI